jgi:phosphate transport system substrate-binding protein
VNLTRFAHAAGVTAVAAMALAACGSNPSSSSTTTAAGSSSTPSASGACPSGTLNAEGSTAQKNAIEQAISDYQDKCSGVTINYNATGSGAGIKQFNGGQVDFAGSDSALKSVAVDGVIEADAAKTRCGGNDAWNLPMAVGPIAISYNVDGVSKLTLTPEVAAKVFSGAITTWNDPAIAKINSGVKLPSTKINVFYRSDESGTTENFTKYLAGAGNGAWTKPPAKAWAGIGSGKNASAGVVQAVQQTKDSITYVEWSYARDAKLPIASIDNGGGPIELTAASAGKAIAAAKPAGSGNDLKLNMDYTTKAAGTYPIVLVTYEVVCSKGLDAQKTALEKGFLSYYANADTQAGLTDLGYAPLPEEVRTKVAAAVEAIQ